MPRIDGRNLARLFLAGFIFAVILQLISAQNTLTGTLPPCPIRWVSGVPCPGCGMTRALLALARGELGLAFALHPFAYLVLFLAVVFAFIPKQVRSWWFGLSAKQRFWSGVVAITSVLALWFFRLFLDSIP